MVGLLFLSALFPLAMGCNPQTGPLSQEAKFHFDVYPPVAWTYYNGSDEVQKPGLKPQSTLAEANTQVKKDVNEAITSTLSEYGASGAEIAVSYAPLRIKKLGDLPAPDPCSTADEYFGYYGDTIFYQCKNGTTSEYAVTEGTVTVTSPLFLYQSQWDSLAVKVQKKLSAKDVVFDEPVHQI